MTPTVLLVIDMVCAVCPPDHSQCFEGRAAHRAELVSLPADLIHYSNILAGLPVCAPREHGLPRPAASLREDPGIGMAPQRSLSGAAVGAADGREAAETDVADAGSLGQGMQEQARSTPQWLVVRFRKAARLRETHRFRLMIPRQG